MNAVELYDCKTQLRQIYESLEAICSVALTIEDHEEYDNAHEMLIVIRNSLNPILRNLENVIHTLDSELN